MLKSSCVQQQQLPIPRYSRFLLRLTRLPVHHLLSPAVAAAGSLRTQSHQSDRELREFEESMNPAQANVREKNRLAQKRFREKQKATISRQQQMLEKMAAQVGGLGVRVSLGMTGRLGV